MVVTELHFVVVLTLQSGGYITKMGVILTHDVVISTNALLFEIHRCSYLLRISCGTVKLASVLIFEHGFQ